MKECVLRKTRYQKGSGVTFHKFPTDKRRLELWLKNIEKPSWRPKKYDYICSKHFSDDCFIKHNTCTTLKKCSIPTIFRSCAENTSSTHESMVLPTPSISGTRMVTPAPPVPETIAIDVKRSLIMDQNNTNLSGRKRDSVAGFVIRAIRKKIKCDDCLVACESLPQDPVLNRRNGIALVVQKTRGGLTIPSTSVVNVCLLVESLFRQACKNNNGKPPIEPNFPAVLTARVLKDLIHKTETLFPDLQNHFKDTLVSDNFNSHFHILLKQVITSQTDQSDKLFGLANE